MVDRVLSELEDHPGRGVLVIDDLHELRSRDALAQLTRLLTNLPPNAHAVLATRRDLSLRLHQLRLAGELAEIRAEDLRFTERETCELLGASGITLSEVGAALLHQRTEGWAAGVRLAVISWPVTLTRSGSSRSSPAASAWSPSTCSPRCSNASLKMSSKCSCVPRC